VFLVHDTENTKEALRVRDLFYYAYRAVFCEFGALTYPHIILARLSREKPHHGTAIESSLNIDSESQ
jgi:hypothetical protein